MTHKTNARGVVKFKIKLPGKGTYCLRDSVRKTAKHPAFKTAWVRFTVK
ncbi:MAG: hypothetical protein WCN81_14010 [Actinomycetes bacterium]